MTDDLYGGAGSINTLDQIVVIESFITSHRGLAQRVAEYVMTSDLAQAKIEKLLIQFKRVSDVYIQMDAEAKANAVQLTAMRHKANAFLAGKGVRKGSVDLLREHGYPDVQQFMRMIDQNCTVGRRLVSARNLRKEWHADVRASIGKEASLEVMLMPESMVDRGEKFVVAYLAGGIVAGKLMGDVTEPATEKIVFSFFVTSLWNSLSPSDFYAAHAMAKSVGQAVGLMTSQELGAALQKCYSRITKLSLAKEDYVTGTGSSALRVISTHRYLFGTDFKSNDGAIPGPVPDNVIPTPSPVSSARTDIPLRPSLKRVK